MYSSLRNSPIRCALLDHEELGSELTLCSCQQKAIRGHLRMCEVCATAHKRGESPVWYAWVYSEYPLALRHLTSRWSPNPEALLTHVLKLHDSLCHRCNFRMPYGYYGVSDAPSSYFADHFRPYLNQTSYEFGLDQYGALALEEKCPASASGRHPNPHHLPCPPLDPCVEPVRGHQGRPVRIDSKPGPRCEFEAATFR